MSKAGRWAVTLALGLTLAGCGGSRQYTLRPVERTSGATGTMKLDQGDNQNTQVELQVRHLPPPDAVDARYKTYVMWLRPAGAQEWKNMGGLRLNDSREAHIKVLTPHPAFEVQVTAEPDATVAVPSGTVVLTGQPD